MTRTRWAHWCWRTRYAAPAPPISWPSWWRLPCRRPCASAYKTSTMSCRRWMFWTHRMPPIWHCSHAPNWVSHSQSCTAGVWCNSRSASSSMPTHWYERAITPLACDFKRLFFLLFPSVRCCKTAMSCSSAKNYRPHPMSAGPTASTPVCSYIVPAWRRSPKSHSSP